MASAAEAIANLVAGLSEKSDGLSATSRPRVRVAARKWRVPDVAVFGQQQTMDQPIGVIEVLTPSDTVAIFGKFADYVASGIEFIWLVSPKHHLIQRYENQSLLRVDAIEFPDRGFRLAAAEIFA